MERLIVYDVPVAPAELEAVLLENEAIADVGVIGVVNELDKNELPR